MSLEQPYFDAIYRSQADPWQFRTRPYEARKRNLTMASLPNDRYGLVFEPGCSIGLLSEQLAARCDRLVAMDLSPFALSQASRTAPANVEFRHGAVPADWPQSQFDLVIISEVGYYLNQRDCGRLADLATATVGDLVAVHWRHPVADYPLSGDEVHRILAAAAERAGMGRLVRHVEDDLRLEVWSHDHRSVAARTGLVEQ